MNWPWQSTGYNLKTHGSYAMTKHPIDGRASNDVKAVFYIAWHKSDQLGDFSTSDDAEARCIAHAEGA